MRELERNNLKESFSHKPVDSLIILGSRFYHCTRSKPLHYLPTSVRHSPKDKRCIFLAPVSLQMRNINKKNIKKLWERRRNELQGWSKGVLMNSETSSGLSFFPLFWGVIFKRDKLHPYLSTLPKKVSPPCLTPVSNFTLAHPLPCPVFPGLSAPSLFSVWMKQLKKVLTDKQKTWAFMRGWNE